jgi:hypothetical protein
LRQLDGDHDRAALYADMSRLVGAGELTVEKDGLPVDDGQLGEVLSQAIDQQLRQFARSGLLTGAGVNGGQ